MALTKIRPMFTTWDLDETINFYVEVLGFSMGCRMDEWQWASLNRDGIELMISGPNDRLDESEPAFTGSIYLDCDDIDAEWSRLKDIARVCYPLETFPYGMREFAIYDNNGYLIKFGCPNSN